MLRKLHIAFFSVLGLLILGCSPSKELPVRTEFHFDYEDQPFEIISITDPSGEGYNYLVQMNQDTSVFRSMDTNQDGYIDLVQYGPFSVDEANMIYLFGIQLAMEQQKFKARNSQRIFTFKDDSVRYTIQTFGNYVDLLYNKFTLFNLNTGIHEVFKDLNADGELDHVESDRRTLSEAQTIYERIIGIGKMKKRIDIMFEKVVVLTDTTQQAS